MIDTGLLSPVRATTAVEQLTSDEVWLRAAPVTTFTQRDPEEGKPVSEATELRIAYDDDALYVAARMHDREPGRIARQLVRRDAAYPENEAVDAFVSAVVAAEILATHGRFYLHDRAVGEMRL